MNPIDMHAAASRVASSLSRPSTVQPGNLPGRLAAPGGTRTRGVSTAVPVTGGSTGSGSTTSSGASQITSNDFLTLLVTEMKNQDPTQPTDPNAYIQQMVEVNSLQQLIAINNDLTPPSAPSGSAGGTGALVGAAPSAASVLLPAQTAASNSIFGS